VAGVIECVTGVLLLIGLLTRPAAFVASGEMAAAYFIYHFPMGGTPVQNMGQTAVILCFVWLHVASRGAGIWSVDAMRGAR
jgi:putative oxidoreductase